MTDHSLLEQFLSEAADLLDQVDVGLLGLERDPGDRAVLDGVFRAAHTLKGSSGLFELPHLTRLTHATEDLLDAVRAGRVELTGRTVDDLLAAFDVVRGWLDVVRARGELPSDAAQVAAGLVDRLRAPVRPGVPVPAPRGPGEPGEPGGPGDPGGAPGPEDRRDGGGLPAAPSWLLDDLGAEDVERVRAWLEHAGTGCRVVRYEPAEGCFFTGDDPVRLVSQIPAVEAFAAWPRQAWPPLAEFDEYRCLLAFTVVTRATVAELDHLFRYVPDEVQVAEVDAAGLAVLLGRPVLPCDRDDAAGGGGAGSGGGTGDDPVAAAAREVLRAQLMLLAAPSPDAERTAREVSAARAVRGALAALGRGGPDVEEVLALAGRPEGREAMTGLVERELRGPQPVVYEGSGRWGPGGVDRRRGGQDRRAPLVDYGRGGRVLKVDQVTVDRLLELVGQLVVAKNGLPFLAAEAEHEWDARPLGRRIKDQYGVVNRISEDLQAAVMDVRMLPLSVVFARFPRLVRDIGRSLGKHVRLELEGQDTAADKDVIEMLADPLIHLVRNSLDHGIERPEVRAAAGKPAEAVVTIRAVQEPDAVVIDVVDDGRGIDPEVVKAKALARGLITQEQLLELGEQEAIELVFLPGFSTVDTISDLSGRGVGMDAVLTSVQAVGGTVRLSSVPGQGSQVRLRVPLSMAISRVMIVAVAGQRFGMPVDLVSETVRLPASRVTRVEHQDVLVLRDQVVPLVDLAATLQLGADRADDGSVSVLVTRSGQEDVGLVVDDFHEGAEVIVKPLEGVLAGSAMFCGTALMGDGSVLLVLDLVEVLAGARVAV